MSSFNHDTITALHWIESAIEDVRVDELLALTAVSFLQSACARDQACLREPQCLPEPSQRTSARLGLTGKDYTNRTLAVLLT